MCHKSNVIYMYTEDDVYLKGNIFFAVAGMH